MLVCGAVGRDVLRSCILTACMQLDGWHEGWRADAGGMVCGLVGWHAGMVGC